MTFLYKVASDYRLYKEYKKDGLRVFLDVMFYAVLIFRLSSFFSSIRLSVVAKVFWLLNRVVFSIDIDPRADLGPGLRIVHGTGLVVGHLVSSAGRLVLYQGVTLGGNSGHWRVHEGKHIEQPTIGENVTIYTGAILVGPIVVPAGKHISAGSKIIE